MLTTAAMSQAPALLGPADPPVFTTIDATGPFPCLVVADHGGRCFPSALGPLGLDPDALERHIAYDIGIDRVTRRLAAALGTPALIHHYSRLLIDPNRPLDDPTSICVISDGQVVPGNRGLTADDMQARIDALFAPYHAELDRILGGLSDRGSAPALIAVHSFTPTMKGMPRPWQYGVLWSDDDRIAKPLIEKLGADPLICVGDNQPYSGRRRYGYTIETHAMARGLPNVLIEIRQDLIATDAGADAWADRLVAPLTAILSDPTLYRAHSVA